MDTGTDGGVADDHSSTTTPTPPLPPAAFAASWWSFAVSQRFQHLLDKSTPYVLHRWIAFFAVAIVYGLRVYLVQGFYVVTYALAIYVLNLLIGFLSPQVDPEFQDLSDGPTLPVRSSDEFRPFVRRLSEFKFWYSITKAFCIAFAVTFFSIFDVPVFWPVLLLYWLILFTVTMRRQIQHMIKYKYVPFSFGKRGYDGKRVPSTDTGSLLPSQ